MNCYPPSGICAPNCDAPAGSLHLIRKTSNGRRSVWEWTGSFWLCGVKGRQKRTPEQAGLDGFYYGSMPEIKRWNRQFDVGSTHE